MEEKPPCCHCGSNVKHTWPHIRRANNLGRKLFCNRVCFGLNRQLNRTDEEKKRLKSEYDAKYRLENKEMLKAKKAAHHQKTYDPVKAAIHRKTRMARHVEYCRSPEYVAWKKEYDRKRRAKKVYGGFWSAAISLMDLERECLSRQSRYEMDYQNGKIAKSQQRKRDYVRQINCN